MWILSLITVIIFSGKISGIDFLCPNELAAITEIMFILSLKKYKALYLISLLLHALEKLH